MNPRMLVLFVSAALALIALGAHAQQGLVAGAAARWLAQGGAGTAGADDAAAIDFNPANLAWFNESLAARGFAPTGKRWVSELSATSEFSGGLDLWGGLYAGAPAAELGKRWGVSLGGTKTNLVPRAPLEARGVQLGGGYAWGHWAAGLSVTRFHAEGDVIPVGGVYLPGHFELTETKWNLGVSHSLPQEGKGPIRLGAVARDVTGAIEDVGTTYCLGVSWPLSEGTTLNFDWTDMTNELQERLNFGLETRIGRSPCRFRIGVMNFTEINGADAIATVGLGHQVGRWSVDYAYLNLPAGMPNSHVLSASVVF